MLYLYGLVAEDPGPVAGISGEPVRAVALSRFLVACGSMDGAPAVSPDALRAHDAVVRRLWEASSALLPVRFGEVVKDEDELRELLDPRSDELGEAIELVRGREQMTLRVFGRVGDGAGAAAAAGSGAGTGTEAEGPGARYLAGLREAREWGRRAPEIDAIRPAIALLVRAERIERRAAPVASDPGASSIVTVYHLVGRGEGRLYREAVERAAPAAGAPRLSVSGPWPPYAFCREVRP